MKAYIVAHIDWMENDLILEQVEANDWREAWMSHSKVPFTLEWPVPDNIEDAKQACFDVDCMMSHIEVKA